MSEHLIRRDFTFRAEMVYEVDRPHLSHPDYYTIKPDMVKITFDRETERAPWVVDWVSVTGHRIVKGDKAGLSRAQHSYSAISLERDKHMPRWLTELVAHALADVESIRTAV